MTGILKLAYRLLVNDKAKFRALLVGITFAVFLMIQMLAIFAGVLNRASATVFNLGASIGSWTRHAYHATDHTDHERFQTGGTLRAQDARLKE